MRKKQPISWAEFARISNRNQRSKWLKKITLCLAAIADITGSNSKELYKAEGINDLFNDHTAELRQNQYLVDNVIQDSTIGTESVQNYTQIEKDITYLINLTKLVGLQLYAVIEDYVITEKERTEMSNKALQQEGVLHITTAKIMKIQ